MKSYVSWRTFIRWLGIALCCLSFPKGLVAESQDNSLTSRELDFYELQCPIMDVDRSNSTLLVCERVIELTEVQEGHRRLRTMLRNHDGSSIPFASFARNQWVFIRGFEQPDGPIFAREIYQLPGKIEQEDRWNYPFFRAVPTWEWEEFEE